MSGNSTRETDASVKAFLDQVEHAGRRSDAYALLDLMRRVTGVEPKLWGPAMVGFGRYHYRYESGREGDMFRVGFSPRKGNLALYLLEKDAVIEDLLSRLGKHKRGVSCLYLNRLADADAGVLEALVARCWALSRERYGEPE
jgi:hypothetical protein